MDRKFGLLALCFVAAALAGGCSPLSGPVAVGSETDQQQVQSSVASVPEVMDDGLFDSSEPAAYSIRGEQSPLNQPEGDPEPTPEPDQQSGRRFWRVIHDVDRQFEITFVAADSGGRPRGAVVTVHKTFNGSFHTQTTQVGVGSLGQDTVIVQNDVKPLHDTWVRKLWLARVTPEHAGDREWRIVAASAAEATSLTDQHPHITSVHLAGGGLDVTLTDPTAAIFWRDLPRVASGVDVDVTVTTQAPDDVVVFMHRGERVFLTPNGDNTYSGTWRTQALVGIRHFGVNALAPQCFETGGEYRSHAWLFPYLNQGELVSDGL